MKGVITSLLFSVHLRGSGGNCAPSAPLRAPLSLPSWQRNPVYVGLGNGLEQLSHSPNSSLHTVLLVVVSRSSSMHYNWSLGEAPALWRQGLLHIFAH